MFTLVVITIRVNRLHERELGALESVVRGRVECENVNLD